VGKDGKVFKMYKFRTMYETLVPVGGSVSPQGDPRVTPIGRFLRRTKLNEVPQLLNILKGDMTFVGPRPEAPDLVALYPDEAREVFTVKPGLVGPNQILGRNEEEWYPADVDPQKYYIEHILPKKLLLDFVYVRESSFWKDLMYILLGVKETLFKIVSWKLVLQNRSQFFLLGSDCVAILFSFRLAHLLTLAESATQAAFITLLPLLFVIIVIRTVCFLVFGLYNTLIRYLSYADVLVVCKAITVGSLLLMGFAFLLELSVLSKLFLLIDCLTLTMLMSAWRFGLRLARNWRELGREENRRRVLIFGAGDAGSLAYQGLIAEKGRPFEVVGFLDDDPAKRHKTLHGKKVLGNRFNLETVVKLYQIQEIFLALPSAPLHEVIQIRQACQRAKVPYRIFPTLKGNNAYSATPPFTCESLLSKLLGLPNIHLNVDAVHRLLQGKNVLVTGASGALGVELCRLILRCSPHKLIIVERYESYLSELMSQLLNTFPADCIVPVLCPPTGNRTVAAIYQEHQPHIVFHMAMRKYLPWFDYQVEAIVQSNYFYTLTLAKQAIKNSCEYFVVVSSTAVATHGNPISDSLRVMETTLRIFFAPHQTQLVILRLCDVLENRGSIVPILENQIARREPVTLPHRDATCQLLSKEAAAAFILEAFALATSNSSPEGIFVCNQGTPTPLIEVTRQLAMLYGLQLEVDLPVKFFNENCLPAVVIAQSPLSNPNRLVPTANPSISLLYEHYPPEIIRESCRLLQLHDHQEESLGHMV
jgi:FlaA1/EpsC-like NDP-sugar epimerase/lipopolysaccharide/colanic/teichoic acid biosynthesis glycosyltransferase